MLSAQGDMRVAFAAVYDPKDFDQYLVKMVFDLYHNDIAGLEASFKISGELPISYFASTARATSGTDCP